MDQLISKMLIFFAIFPVLFALSPGNSRAPVPDEPIRAFHDLFKECAELKKYLPLNASIAEIWFFRMKKTLFAISKFKLDLRDGKTESNTTVPLVAPSLLPAMWNHDLSRFGYYLYPSTGQTFEWNHSQLFLEPPKIHLGKMTGTFYGFATKDFVYTQVIQEEGTRKFARWNVDLSGEVEILGDASPEDHVLFFEHKLGLTYYLTDNKCLQIDDLEQLHLGYQSFRECDTNQGMFVLSDLNEWYSLSAFAWLTRECNDEIWSKYWAHVFVKIRFLPGDPPKDGRPNATTTVTTTTWTTATTIPTITSTTTIHLPTETSFEDITFPPEQLCLIPSTPSSYAIAIFALTAFFISVSIANGIVCFFMRRRYQKEKCQDLPQDTLSNRKQTTGPRETTYSSTTMRNSTNISRLETMASISSRGLPPDAVTKLLLSPEISKIFDRNEVEGMEAELPKKPLERPPEPGEGFYFSSGKIGVTIPAKTFDKTFGEFEMEMGGELCTVQYEDVKSELNRIEAMAAVMRQGKKYQKNGTIPEFIVTVHLDHCYFRLLVMKKLGPSIEKRVCNGTLSVEERLKLVSLTFNCMEDLLFSNIIHRDIKPSSFYYEFSGSKILISNLGLSRITPKSPRLKVPFFGNLTFCSPSTHLKLERTHFDDMLSYFYVVLWIFNKDLLIWRNEDDKTVVYQLKSDIMEGNVLEDRLEKFIPNKKIKDFLSQLFPLILKLPPKRPSYRQIKEMIEKINS